MFGFEYRPIKPPEVEPSTEGNFRWPASILFGIGSVGLFIAALVALFAGASQLALWMAVGGIVSVVLAQILVR